MVENENLSVDQIQTLSAMCPNYIIPHNQKKSKRYGLILFNSADRHGAEREADNLELALQDAGCDVIKMEWACGVELGNMIERALRRIVDDCSLVIVCLMSHGCRAVLRRTDGEDIPVNNILHQLSYTLPDYVPLVSLFFSVDFLLALNF